MGHVVMWTDGGAKITREADTMGCKHCQRVLLKREHIRNDGMMVIPHWCGNCGAYVCHGCYAKMQTEGCRPFKQLIDAQWDRFIHRRI